MKRVTITSTRYHMRYHTFSLSLTWIDHNGRGYHNFNVLPQALPYIFSQFSVVWGPFAMGYHTLLSILKKKKCQNDQGVTELVIKPFGMS